MLLTKQTIKQSKKEKEYIFNVDLKFTQTIQAPNKTKAIKQLKKTFIEEYGIEPTNKEIKLIN